MFARLFLLLSVLLMTGCDTKKFTIPDEGRTTPEVSECKMGGCSWSKFEILKINKISNETTEVQVLPFYASTTDEDTAPNTWEKDDKVNVQCSHLHPNYNGIALKLDRSPSGAELSIVESYYNICHSYQGDLDQAKEKFGY